MPPVRERLLVERADALERLTALRHDFSSMIDASRHTNADDEHDPEGATIAFERAQLHALVEQAERRLTELDRALDRVGTGEYGTCRVCGGPIGAARLDVRPEATTCVACTR